MKRVIVLIILVVVSVVLLSAEEAAYKTHSVPLAENVEVNIQLEGEIVINSTDSPKADIKVENVVSGTVYGLHFNKKARLNYDVKVEKTMDGVTIKKKSMGSASTIGISTVKERHIHYINLPESAQIFIRSDEAKITVNGYFKGLDIRNRDGDSSVKLVREKIKFIDCTSDEGEILVDGLSHGKQFNMAGEGDGIYNLKSNTGEIKVYFFK